MAIDEKAWRQAWEQVREATLNIKGWSQNE